ncbi:CusA/CzcA family heavy metal efflux RND transporter [Variovorax sp. NFACC27]|uniref:efflux RND transporter permease subunit n=1 Tax=unclassified Variovorax TaxID=663243 RepID=UPI000896D696|nr:cobalt-zinc-cadmium resistance protein CzcA [Variovorax sp. NFACC28]SEG94588.1 cobalt-zinc-cadmium resistance protein CzcA [Variovorax sp. NFACC29]SFD71118.1 cobalt-zinc-cadmium resistance protein CzcA [Variovorax sp. NFACC26]SFG84932.1 cobalt-zinc-cadmium resistance protein CzcA [Variovorax sp. NFACC27]
MINLIITQFFRRRHLAWAMSVALVLFGAWSWTQMTVEAYPDLGDVNVQVTTQVNGLAAEEIEQQITTPLERALSNTPGLAWIRSSSTFGLSLITLTFKDGTDDYFARQRVTERIGQVSLPSGAQPGLGPVAGPAGEIYRYTLESDTKNLMELSELQRWKVIPALKQVAGVVDINNFGGFTKEFQLELDPARLQKYGLVLNDVVTAINNNSANAGGGRIARGDQSYVVRGIGQIRTLDDLGTVVVAQSNGSPVLVRDLGRLQFGHQERGGILGKDTSPDTIEGIVLMLKYENPSRVLEGVHRKIDELQAELAPMGVKIVPYIDRDDLVKLTVDKVTHTVLEGMALVCFVLILFLGSPRSAVVAAVAIPMSLVTVFIVMHFTRMPANLFSLGAIDFGIIVDGAIVVMEAILRRREEEPHATLTEGNILETVSHVSGPIFFATLIIITAYFPLFAFERAEGKLFKPMAFTVGYALVGALLCALTLIPSLAYVALRKPSKPFVNKPLVWLTAAYRRVLARLLDLPAVAYGLSVAALAAVVVLGATAGREFLPDIDEGALWLQVQLPSGLSLDKASEMATELRHVLLEYPEVSYVVTQLGRNDDGTDPWTPSHMEVPLGLKPYSEWPAGVKKADFVRTLTERFARMPGFDVGISQPIIDGVNDAVGGAHSPLVLRIYGDDLKESRRIGNQIVDLLETVRGTASASLFQEPPIPQVVIQLNREAAARFGVNANDVASLIQTGIGGAPVITVYSGNRTYNVSVKMPKSAKGNTEAIGALLLNSSGGAKVPLSQVADIRLQTGESTISHEMNERQITVRVDNRDRDLASYLDEARDRIAKEVKFDATKFRLQWAGQFENQQRAQARLGVSLAIVVCIMAVLLFFQFGKIRQVALILGVVPMATLGGLIAVHVAGETLNVATAVGFIALFGVSIQNGIIMVANFRRVRGEGLELQASVLEGATERLRPVLMTATVASVGMLPAALATGVGTDVQRGLATVVVGGLVVSTLLTLFILPTLYFAMERLFERKGWGTRSRRDR